MSKRSDQRARAQPELAENPSVTIIVEGHRDAVILRSLFDKKIPDPVRFFAAQGRMSITSLARNVLVHEPDPVVIILDADSASASKVESEQASALDALYPSTRYRVFAFSPSLDKIVEDVIRREISDGNISREEMELLQAHPQVRRLLDVILGYALPRSDSVSLAASSAEEA